MSTLYRKYRPRFFSEIVGQHHIKATLEQEIKMNRLAHAYLFCGPRGVGKTTLARIMARAVNCPERKNHESEPCNACESCTAMNEGSSLTLLEIDAASHRGINEIRELREQVKFFPQQGTYKICIIDEVHMLTAEAFNALLKTLEEPPTHAIFILATTEVHKLPDTIISRCQRFDFKKLPPQELKVRLLDIAHKEGVSLEEDILDTLILRAEGCGRDAESILGQLVSLGEDHITWEKAGFVLPRSDRALIDQWIEAVINKTPERALTLIQTLIDEGVDIERFTQDTMIVVRKLMMDAISAQQSEISHGYFTLLDKLINRLPDIRKMAEMPQLPFELVAIEMSIQPTRFSQDTASSQQTTLQPTEPSQAGPGAAFLHEPLQPAQPPSSSTDIQLIIQRWEEVLDYIQQHAPSLSFVLGVAQPTTLQQSTLTIAFSYKFHQDIINNAKNKVIVQQALSSVFGGQYTIQTVTQENQQNPQQENQQNDVVALALETFEGVVTDV